MYSQTHTHFYYAWRLRYLDVASAYQEHMKSSEYNDHLYITNSMRHLHITNYHELIKSSKRHELNESSNYIFYHSSLSSLIMKYVLQNTSAQAERRFIHISPTQWVTKLHELNKASKDHELNVPYKCHELNQLSKHAFRHSSLWFFITSVDTCVARHLVTRRATIHPYITNSKSHQNVTNLISQLNVTNQASHYTFHDSSLSCMIMSVCYTTLRHKQSDVSLLYNQVIQ